MSTKISGLSHVSTRYQVDVQDGRDENRSLDNSDAPKINVT